MTGRRATNYAYLRSCPGARYQSAMSDREPALLRDPGRDDGSGSAAKGTDRAPDEAANASAPTAPTAAPATPVAAAPT
ncbi:MAG TPA: hypothetical protein VHT91_27305, partial [Kofleriaceae bacterium]|nr:hypothetical protein [Kofleriaceae bacterium]